MSNGALTSLLGGQGDEAESTAATGLAIVQNDLGKPKVSYVRLKRARQIPPKRTASVGLKAAKWLRRSSLVVAQARLLKTGISKLDIATRPSGDLPNKYFGHFELVLIVTLENRVWKVSMKREKLWCEAGESQVFTPLPVTKKKAPACAVGVSTGSPAYYVIPPSPACKGQWTSPVVHCAPLNMRFIFTSLY